MAQNDIDDVLDQLTRIKSGGDLSSFKIDQIVKLEMHLRFLRTFTKYHHVILPDFLVKITKKVKLIMKMLHSVFGGIPDECKTNLIVKRLVSQLLKCIEGNTSSMCNFELNDGFDLSKYMDYLEKNLNDVMMCLELDRTWCNFECRLNQQKGEGWGVVLLVGIVHTPCKLILNEKNSQGNLLFGNYEPRCDLASIVEKYMNKELESEKFKSLLEIEFWKMEKLRHVEITSAAFDLEEDRIG